MTFSRTNLENRGCVELYNLSLYLFYFIFSMRFFLPLLSEYGLLVELVGDLGWELGPHLKLSIDNDTVQSIDALLRNEEKKKRDTKT